MLGPIVTLISASGGSVVVGTERDGACVERAATTARRAASSAATSAAVAARIGTAAPSAVSLVTPSTAAGVDTLVEHGDEHGVERHAVGFADETGDGGGRRTERPGDGLGELGAVRRPSCPPAPRRVARGSRQSIDRAGHELEPQRAGADPAPPAFDGRRDTRRDVGSVELLEGGERHHRLVERDAQERGDVDRTLGLVAEHVQRAAGRGNRPIAVGGGRERRVDRVADERRRQRLGRTVEVGAVGGRDVPLGEPSEDRVDVGLRERLAIDDGDLCCGVGRRLPLAETQTELLDARRPPGRSPGNGHDRCVGRPGRGGGGRLGVVAAPPAAGHEGGHGERDRARSLPRPRTAPHATSLLVVDNLTNPSGV